LTVVLVAGRSKCVRWKTIASFTAHKETNEVWLKSSIGTLKEGNDSGNVYVHGRCTLSRPLLFLLTISLSIRATHNLGVRVGYIGNTESTIFSVYKALTILTDLLTWSKIYIISCHIRTVWSYLRKSRPQWNNKNKPGYIEATSPPAANIIVSIPTSFNNKW
jgi:hypothetical protein